MRVKFKKAGKLPKLIFIIVLVYALVTVGFLQTNISQKQARKQELSSQLETLTRENEELNQSIEKMDTDEGVRSIAREELDLVGKDEIVFYDLGQ